MKKHLTFLLCGFLIVLTGCQTMATAKHGKPKKLLVVSTTTGFRHSSIPTLEKVLTQLGKDSGAFTVDFVQQPPGHAETGFPARPRSGASPEEKKAFDDAEAKWNEALKLELQKLSPANLENYDAVVFASTTGDLPIPDKDGFLAWLKQGHAFIGIHAAGDTFHHWPEFIDMIGGEFSHHGAQVGVECMNEDPAHPANAHLGKSWAITQEEIYEFKKYDASKLHDLLILKKAPQAPHAPGHYPVSWCKVYGAKKSAAPAHLSEMLMRKNSGNGGRIFYTSLGHREDIIDTDPALKDRRNSVEISKAYQAHILGGIEWALGQKR